MAGWVRRIGAMLLVAGCATWAWVAALEGPVDATADEVAYWYVELELFVIDLRLAPLLLASVGVGLLVAPVVRSFGMGVAVVLGAAVAAEVVTATLDFASVAPAVTAFALLVVLLGVVLMARRGSGPDEEVTRQLTTSLGVVLLCSSVPMEVYVEFDAGVLDALPEGYVASVRVLQALMLVAGMSCVLLGMRRLTPFRAAVVVVTVAGLALLFATPALSFDWVEIGALCVAAAVLTGCIVAGAGSSPLRVAVAAVVTGLSYPLVLWISAMMGFGLGSVPLGLNGGQIDYDGLPIFLAGPISAMIVAFTVWGAGWIVLPPETQSTRRDPAHPMVT